MSGAQVFLNDDAPENEDEDESGLRTTLTSYTFLSTLSWLHTCPSNDLAGLSRQPRSPARKQGLSDRQSTDDTFRPPAAIHTSLSFSFAVTVN